MPNEWDNIGNIKGAPGAAGAPGADGAPGPPGPPGISGQRTPVTAPDANTLTPDYKYDMVIQNNTQAAGTLTVANPTTSEVGTPPPAEGRGLLIRIKTTNAQTLVFDTQYRAPSYLPLPAGTTAAATMYLGFVRNAVDSKWDLSTVLRDY